MQNSTRLIVNTSAQYARTLINLVLSLYSTRVILSALGIQDYGVYTLIAGVVSMLAFMTNAMVSTTQRFMSFHQTKSNLEVQQRIFGNSVLMHIFFSLGVLILLEIVGLFLFDGFLNIAPERVPAAKIVYQCAITMILCSFITAPFKALLISHENLVYISIIDVLDGVTKVGVAFLLIYVTHDKLILYGYLMIAIYVLNLIAFSVYDFRKYKECVIPKIKNFNKEYLKSMSSFVGWQLYSTGCVIGRTQGTAIILNKFFGTVVNAAFGIALQVSGAVNFISSALVTSINPQIVKAEGSGDRKKMFDLAKAASKFSFLLLAMVVVPISFVLPEVLKLWLGEIPEYSVLFCRVILYTALLDQITYGLISANQAIGNIGPYALTINSIKILTLPCLWILLKCGVELSIAIWIYAVLEAVCALARLPFLKYNGGLNIRKYSEDVFLRIIVPLGLLAGCYLFIQFLNVTFIVFLICAVPITLIYWTSIYLFSLNEQEKGIISQMYSKLLHRKK
ncbi:MAG: hypothetical protein HDS87_05375 [Bacteroidales bacterium]|nr:hypothetical protein [Bacteroidales bacterium]